MNHESEHTDLALKEQCKSSKQTLEQASCFSVLHQKNNLMNVLGLKSNFRLGHIST